MFEWIKNVLVRVKETLKRWLGPIPRLPVQVETVNVKPRRQRMIDQLRQTAPKYPAQLTGMRMKWIWTLDLSPINFFLGNGGLMWDRRVVLKVTTANGIVFRSDPTNLTKAVAKRYIQQHLPVSVHVDGQGHSYVVVEELPPFLERESYN